MKKILTLLLASIMLLSTTSPSFAYTNNLDEKLRKMGVPEDSIVTMSVHLKKDIVENCTEFISFEKVSLDTNDASPSTRGTISTSDMDFYINVYRTDNSADNRERFNLYITYRWKNMPATKKDDPFGVAWDSNEWRAVDNTSYCRVDWRNMPMQKWYNESETAIAYSSESGVGWNAALVASSGYGTLDKLEGYGKITIESKTVGSISGSSQIHANYSHVYGIIGSIGLSFGPVSVGYSGSRSADSRGTYKTFSY